MTEKIKALCSKYRELIVYFIVGVITTLVNWIVSFVLEGFLLDAKDPVQNMAINIIAWVVAVGVSFPMNRRWVFQSKNPKWGKELVGFTSARISTMLIELLFMYLCVNKNLIGILLRIPEGSDNLVFRISKILVSVIVMILNYVFSKLLVFKKGQQDAT